MRKARIIEENGAFYHIISRVIERKRILGIREKEVFRRIMRKTEGFCAVRILTYAILDSHWHILAYVPARKEVSDSELIKRLAFLYPAQVVKEVADKLVEYRKNNLHASAELLKKSYTYRMYNLSEFCKTLKQRFSQYYNRNHDRCGTLWDQRFKSILVESRGRVVQTVAAYIDLNAVRAGIVEDPKDYRFCGYGEAMGGSKRARDGLNFVMDCFAGRQSWQKTASWYRTCLFSKGETRTDGDGRPVRKGFDPKHVEEVLNSGGRLPQHEILRCRVRYFTDGLVLGSEKFVEGVFSRYRDQFGVKRTSGARPMKYGQWDGLCTMRDLRKAVVVIPSV